MTVTVQTPSGEVSGSAVTAVRWSKHWIQSDGMGWDYALAGEAVVVEVTPGHYLFALLRSAATTEYMGSVAAAAISGQEGRVIDTSLFAQVEARQGEASRVIELPANQYPLMVTFTDLGDPKSVELVRPSSLSSAFGPGISLTAITLEIVDLPVTTGGVEAVLPWIDRIGGGLLDGSRLQSTNVLSGSPNSIGVGFFKSSGE
jgi:hypothetical protein